MVFNKEDLYVINIDKMIESFEDYRIDSGIIRPIKKYGTEHLIREYTRSMYDINSYIHRSTEGLMDNIKKALNWLLELIKKIILHVTTFLKFIIAKIREITIKSKNSLYKKFNNKVFTSLDIEIKDRKLNPQIMDFVDIYIEFWEANIRDTNFEKLEKVENLTTAFEVLDNMRDSLHNTVDGKVGRSIDEVFFNLNKGVNYIIDSWFYEEAEPRKMNLKEYFGCKEGETPEAIVLLSDTFIKKLIMCKNNTEKFLKNLISYKKTLEKNNELYGAHNREENVKTIKEVFKNITLFHNLNYTFFIKLLKIREKVSKYISKGILGPIAENDSEKTEKLEEKKSTLIKFRDLPNAMSEERYYDDKLRVRYTGTRIIVDYNDKTKNRIDPNDNEFTKAVIECFNKLDKYGNFKYLYQADKNAENVPLFQFFQPVIDLLNIPIENPFENLAIKEIFWGTQSLQFCLYYASTRFDLNENDVLYHTSENKLNFLKGFNNSLDGVIYSSNRIYVGVNKIYSKYGFDIDKNSNLYLYKIPCSFNKDIEVILDPELGGNAGYINLAENEIENFDRIDEYL